MVLTTSVHAIHTVDNLRASSGGPSRSVPAVCDALAEIGIKTTLLSAETDPRAQLVRPARPEAQLRLINTNPRTGLMRGVATPFGQAIADAVSPDTPTVIHTHGLWVPSNRAVALAARAAGCPLVISPKGMLSKHALRVKRAKKQIGWHLYQRQVLQMAAAFQATSEAEAEDLRRLGFRQPVAVIPHGVSPSPHAPPQQTEKTKTALFLSRFHPIKGLPDLIEAWALVKPSGWRLLLVGPDEGGHRAEIRKLVIDRELGDVVEIRDSVNESEKSELFASADLFVLATHSENFGVVVAEALAAGLPVITTQGAPWEALVTHHCGWWVEPGSNAFANALRDATAQSREDLRAMGMRGRDYVETHLSWKRSAEAHTALYQWLLDAGPKPTNLFET